MFGKPEWFVPNKFGWGLTPVTWQGWAYVASWAAASAVGFFVLLAMRENGWVEGILWIGAMIAFAFYDVKMILRAIKRKDEDKDLLMIMDDKETRREETQTAKFQMHVAQRDR
jgi:hypothetical protein